MDIRIASYNTGTARPVNVTTFSQKGNPLATAYVQSAAQNGPVNPVPSVNMLSNSGSRQVANGDGYTDHIRGSLINILA